MARLGRAVARAKRKRGATKGLQRHAAPVVRLSRPGRRRRRHKPSAGLRESSFTGHPSAEANPGVRVKCGLAAKGSHTQSYARSAGRLSVTRAVSTHSRLPALILNRICLAPLRGLTSVSRRPPSGTLLLKRGLRVQSGAQRMFLVVLLSRLHPMALLSALVPSVCPDGHAEGPRAPADTMDLRLHVLTLLVPTGSGGLRLWGTGCPVPSDTASKRGSWASVGNTVAQGTGRLEPERAGRRSIDVGLDAARCAPRLPLQRQSTATAPSKADQACQLHATPHQHYSG